MPTVKVRARASEIASANKGLIAARPYNHGALRSPVASAQQCHPDGYPYADLAQESSLGSVRVACPPIIRDTPSALVEPLKLVVYTALVLWRKWRSLW
jgi:hypothetical protein